MKIEFINFKKKLTYNSIEEIKKYREIHKPIDESIDAKTFYREEIFADRNVIKYDDNDNILGMEKMDISEFNDMIKSYKEAGHLIEEINDTSKYIKGRKPLIVVPDWIE